MDGWNPTSPAPPKSLPDPLSIPALPLRDGTIPTSLSATSTLPAPLPTPSACSPQPPTPLKGTSSSGGMVGVSVGPGPGPMSPPTPAPSPSPRARHWEYRDELGEDADHEEDGMDGAERRGGSLGSQGGGEMDVDDWTDGEVVGRKGKGRAVPGELFASALSHLVPIPSCTLGWPVP